MLNAISKQWGAEHGEVCLLSEPSHPGPASLSWKGVTSSDLHTINTDWEPTQRNNFLSESTSQSWKHSGRKKSNCFPLSLPEDYPFVSTWSRWWLLTLEPAHCLNSWNKVREKRLLLNASQWGNAVSYVLAEKKKRPGNRWEGGGKNAIEANTHTQRSSHCSKFKKISKFTFWGHQGFITVCLFRLLSTKFPKSKLASHAGNFEVFAQSG